MRAIWQDSAHAEADSPRGAARSRADGLRPVEAPAAEAARGARRPGAALRAEAAQGCGARPPPEIGEPPPGGSPVRSQSHSLPQGGSFDSFFFGAVCGSGAEYVPAKTAVTSTDGSP